MLKSIHVENYVLIQSLDLDFETGFSAITGETGAGKSILIGALGLVLGARADLKSISENAEKCIIEATFDISSYNLNSYFEENDLDYSDECIIRRELLKSGKSRMFLNDSPVSASILKSIGEKLIDIHSQHNNLLLRDNTFQLGIVDQIAENKETLKSYQECFHTFKELEKRLKQAKEASEQSKSDYEYIAFQLKQLKEANIKEGEIEELENNLNIWEHAADIKTNLSVTESILNDDNGIIQLLKSAEHSLSSAAKHQTDLNSLIDRINSTAIELKDIANEVSRENNHIDIDEQELAFARERIDLLYSLQQKHKVSGTNALIAIREKLEQQLESIDGSDEHIAELEKALDKAQKELQNKAILLSQTRNKVTEKIECQLIDRLMQLGMPNAKFKVEISEIEPNINGIDFVSFLFSSNKQSQLQPAAQVASGGEISRLMLSIKELVASSKQLPTLIFDEIDTGISGEVASKMGNIMRSMANNAQIICITHLPQIAAMGANQYKVYKIDDETTTQTMVKKLTKEERPIEIAKMLSGTTVTDVAIENARTLLNL